jgi:hypothetical protein
MTSREKMEQGTEMLSMIVNLGAIIRTYYHNYLPSRLMLGIVPRQPPLNILKLETGRNAGTHLLELRHQLLPDPLL